MASAELTYNVHTGAINAILHSPGGEVGRDIQRRGRLVVQRARSLVPVKTGALRNSISMQTGSVGGEVSVSISASARHAMWVHEGTAPHSIHGNPLLVFYWPRVGRTVFFRHVNHPGTKAVPFLRDALDAARG
jgi:hypothetical protein